MLPIDFKKAREFTGGTLLLHGNYGSGKTHLLGDYLRFEAERTKQPVFFINMKGEDGYTTVVDLEDVPGIMAVTVDTYDDLMLALTEAKKLNASAGGIDGYHRIYPFTFRKKLGADRLPIVGGSTNEWSECHKLVEDLTDTLRYYAPFIFCTSASDKSVDQIKGETQTTPNFAGRNAAGIAGHFDYVFCLENEVLGPGKIRRVLRTAPVAKMVVRYRLPKPLPTELVMPEGRGGWKMIRAEIEKAIAPAVAAPK